MISILLFILSSEDPVFCTYFLIQPTPLCPVLHPQQGVTALTCYTQLLHSTMILVIGSLRLQPLVLIRQEEVGDDHDYPIKVHGGQ